MHGDRIARDDGTNGTETQTCFIDPSFLVESSCFEVIASMQFLALPTNFLMPDCISGSCPETLQHLFARRSVAFGKLHVPHNISLVLLGSFRFGLKRLPPSSVSGEWCLSRRTQSNLLQVSLQ
jgi:hypothetical protein